MCGIAGIVGRRAVNPDTVSAMNRLQAHRGPDGEGVWSNADGTVVLGHRRLAIIDLSEAAAQPMLDVTGRYALTYNGEIYNYLELRAELGAVGARFQTASDSEVILEAYKAWGPDCVRRFNGMFAFALLDTVDRQLFCARDRFGEKPFLFTEGDGYFAFGSEYKALLTLAGVSDEVDTLALLTFLIDSRQGLDDRAATVFRGIQLLLPGETLQLDTVTLQRVVRRYWTLEPRIAGNQPNLSDAVGIFGSLLKDAVRLRFRSDVPVGSCLSGGLDSSTIVCIARDLIGQESHYHVFTGRFPGTASDEGAFSALVAEQTNALSHEVVPTGGRFLNDLPLFMWHNELPVGSSSQYAQWSVFRLAKEAGVTVLLDGQGADEVLGGYEQYFLNHLEGLRRSGRKGTLRAETARIAARYPGLLPSPLRRIHQRMPVRWRRPLARLLGRGSHISFGINRDLAGALNRDMTDLRSATLLEAMAEDAAHKHLPTLLRYGDRNSMAHSREVRLPFCDHRIADFVFSLDPMLVMGNGETKRLLREATRNVLPEPIRTRWRKQGFLPPQESWFNDTLAGHAEEVFTDPQFASSGLWDARWWQQALSRFRAGETHLAWTLWKPLIAAAWDRHFLASIRSLPKLAPFTA